MALINSGFVRDYVAQNENTPLNVLTHLLTDKDFRVRDSVVRNKTYIDWIFKQKEEVSPTYTETGSFNTQSLENQVIKSKIKKETINKSIKISNKTKKEREF